MDENHECSLCGKEAIYGYKYRDLQDWFCFDHKGSVRYWQNSILISNYLIFKAKNNS